MHSSHFNVPDQTEFSLDWTTVPTIRAKLPPSTKIMVAIGGWGDTEGFSVAAKTKESQGVFAENVRRMLDITGADGIDIASACFFSVSTSCFPTTLPEDQVSLKHLNIPKSAKAIQFPPQTMLSSSSQPTQNLTRLLL